jgi:hypothetical protein
MTRQKMLFFWSHLLLYPFSSNKNLQVGLSSFELEFFIVVGKF